MYEVKYAFKSVERGGQALPRGLHALYKNRAYSEMPSCPVILELPRAELGADWQKIVGEATAHHLSTPQKILHFYLRQKGETSDEDLICDIAAGQLIDPLNMQLPKGERIRQLQNQAVKAGKPGLVHDFGEGVVVVMGSRKELFDVFGFTYNDVEEIPEE